MAKRKRRPAGRKGFKFQLGKDYQSERYTMYVMNVEIGILQASTIDSDLTDGDVSEALEDLILQLKEPGALSKLLSEQESDDPLKINSSYDEGMSRYVQPFILMNLRSAFDQYGALEVEDVTGILDVIKTSVKRRNVGMHRRGYLTYIEGFLGQMGITVRQVSEEEVEEFDLEASDNLIEGEYDEIE